MTNEETTKTEEAYFVGSVKNRTDRSIYWLALSRGMTLRQLDALPLHDVWLLTPHREEAYHFPTKAEPFRVAETWHEQTFQYDIDLDSLRVYFAKDRTVLQRSEQEVARLPPATVPMTTANQKVTHNG